MDLGFHGVVCADYGIRSRLGNNGARSDKNCEDKQTPRANNVRKNLLTVDVILDGHAGDGQPRVQSAS